MARILYGSQVDEIRGSIGGLSFQRTQAGTICRLKPSRVQRPTNLVSVRKNIFAAAVSAWSQLSTSVKQDYNDLAASQTFYDYWGQEKTISGFNLMIKQYCNCITCGETWAIDVPVSFTPTAIASYSVFIYDDVLSIHWDPAFNHGSDFLLIYMSPPIMSTGLNNRKLLRLIKVSAPETESFIDVNNEWLAAFGFSALPNPASGSYNIITMIVAVRDGNFLNSAGSFYLFSLAPS